MASPAVLGYGRPAANNDWIVGPIIASLAIVALWEIARGLRWLNLPIGVWLLVAPWVLGAPVAAIVSEMATGLLVTAMVFVHERPSSRYGGGWPVALGMWRRMRAG